MTNVGKVISGIAAPLVGAPSGAAEGGAGGGSCEDGAPSSEDGAASSRASPVAEMRRRSWTLNGRSPCSSSPAICLSPLFIHLYGGACSGGWSRPWHHAQSPPSCD